jgi:hypothetical protein
MLRSRPLTYELTGVCSSVAVPPCGALEENPGSLVPLLRAQLGAAAAYPEPRRPASPTIAGPDDFPIDQTGRRVNEVLDLLAMWALLQVLFVWCFARGDGLGAQPGCAASPYTRSNPDSTKKDNLENLDAC